MKRITLTTIIILVITTCYTKVYSSNLVLILDGTVLKEDTLQQAPLIPVYKLFPTENVWTFIKLNTRNGKMWQVQYDIEGDNRFETYLNIIPLAFKDKEVNGRFTLQATQNVYTFILLDQIDGKMWQVQWSIEPENRFVIPIE